MEEGTVTAFSRLFVLLHSAYEASSLACQVLATSCYNHQNLLKRWPLPETEEISECTCQPCYDEPEEIEKDVVDAVERAKATRERLTQMKSINRGNVVKPVSDKSSGSSSYPRREKINKCSSVDEGMRKDKQKNIGKSDYVSTKTQVKYAESHAKKLMNAKANVSNSLQTTYQRDYSVRNSYLTLSSSKPKNLVKEYMIPIPNTKLHAVNNMDVDILLKRVTAGAIPKRISNEKINLDQNIIVDKTCSIHGEGTPTTTHTFVGLKEAIYVLGVPSELLKLLRTYHQYLEVNNSFDIGKKKQIGKDSFLHQLNESNEKCWNRAPSEPVINLYLHHLLIFVEMLSKDKNGASGNLQKDLEDEIGYLNKSYHKIVGTDIACCDNKLLSKKKVDVESSEDVVEKRLWALAGIWNRKCCNRISDLKYSFKISYNQKEDCKLLQKNFQKIQVLDLQIQILEALANDLFPFLKNMNDDHVSLSHLYKSFSALCDITTLSVPVLLKI